MKCPPFTHAWRLVRYWHAPDDYRVVDRCLFCDKERPSKNR